jgi:hypothetical protein
VGLPVWKRTAGLWGPAAFATASIVGGATQPGYDHRRSHISGLAAHGTRSASVMIPGFIILGVASLLMPATARARPVLRTAGVGVVLAGIFRCSDVSCPDPTRDQDATPEDRAHAAVSIVTFIAWTALPFVDASEAKPTSGRIAHAMLGAVTAAGFVVAGVTARSDAANKGVAQRCFLATVFARYVSTSMRAMGHSRRCTAVSERPCRP